MILWFQLGHSTLRFCNWCNARDQLSGELFIRLYIKNTCGYIIYTQVPVKTLQNSASPAEKITNCHPKSILFTITFLVGNEPWNTILWNETNLSHYLCPVFVIKQSDLNRFSQFWTKIYFWGNVNLDDLPRAKLTL